MPVPSKLQDQALARGSRAAAGAAAAIVLLAVSLGVAGAEAPALQPPREPLLQSRLQPATLQRAPFQRQERRGLSPGVAYFVRNLTTPRERREARADILDSPILPGSVVKAVSLVTALEAGAVLADTGVMCRRVVTVDGTRYACAHPDLQRPLSPAEALAYSCDDFFVSLARRLSREQVNRTRLASGLPPLPASASLSASLVGLAGPRVTPRALVDVVARLVGVGPDPPVPMSERTRRVLLEGLTGAATYGTASALGDRGVPAWAKTGTATMPGGGVAGLVVALTPAGRPTHGMVVVAPGGAAMDAATIAADLVAPVAPVAPHPVAPGELPAPGAPATIALGRTLANGRTRIETLALDAYIAEVLAGEGQPSADAAAQQALAITARTFALANRNRHRSEGFDVCDTTHCQVVRASTAQTRQAADATSGQALLHEGQAASVFYSAWCGGRIERASEVWPGAADYGEPGVDDACAGEPAWQNEIRVADVERALRAAGLRGGRLRGLRIVHRNRSGRVVRLRAEGFTPPDISGHDFRMAVGRVGGWQLVKSTAFEIERTGGGFRFRGRGFGHGVGLCVVGAGARAARGESAAAILRFYFPNLTVGPVASGSAITTTGPVTVGAAGAAPAGTREPAARSNAPSTDVQLALPGREEGERTTLLSLVRRARDETARAAGRAAPPALRVTVHPTVESFGRATGQPWWVSGATVGSDIDLLSLTVLRQRGQLERTVRHEVAHALLDPALAERPMWVREGAAIFFSREPGAGSREPDGRVACPSDAEILRPFSAGAQRDAYARAEACFARAIATGTPWHEVR